MEIGTQYKFKDGSIGTLIQKNKNFGLLLGYRNTC
jgi:hypothetical protein